LGPLNTTTYNKKTQDKNKSHHNFFIKYILCKSLQPVENIENIKLNNLINV